MNLPPQRSELREITALRDGNLAETPYSLLLLALGIEERTAVLILQRPPLEKWIVFERGTPIDCQSNVATETLGRFMAAAGKLSDDTLRALLSESASRGVSFESLLVGKQVVDAQELERIRQQNLARKLLDPFGWQSGSFQIGNEVPHVEAPLRVRVPQLILSGIVKLVAQEDVDRAVAPHLEAKLRRNDAPLIPPGELRMVAEQTQLLDALSRGETATAAAARLGIPQEEAHRFLFAALLLGTLIPEQKTAVSEGQQALRPGPAEVAEITQRSRPPGLPFFDDAVTERQPIPPMTPPPAPQPAEGDRRALIETYQTYRGKDPFELLDLPEDAGIGATGAAYLAFAERVAPWRFGEDRDAREKARELFLAAARAYGELIDPEQRQRILNRRKASSTGSRLARPTLPPPPPPPAAPAFQTPARRVPTVERMAPANLLDPEVQYRKGKELFDAGRPREALSYFEFAASCDAQNGVYAAELAYCRFQLLQTTAAQAVASLRQVLRVDPRCGLAYLYLGKILAAIGNTSEAEGNLRKATQLMRTDRRAYEALQALSRK